MLSVLRGYTTVQIHSRRSSLVDLEGGGASNTAFRSRLGSACKFGQERGFSRSAILERIRLDSALVTVIQLISPGFIERCRVRQGIRPEIHGIIIRLNFYIMSALSLRENAARLVEVDTRYFGYPLRLESLAYYWETDRVKLLVSQSGRCSWAGVSV